ncbi:hypothetical protein NS226_23710 [Aureimonas ureilytica]|uniref:Uncharacterized protein n=1 Tax=Aureimonas ureilytica TaxID=401562 RepID=A0A175QDH9_9HYPH|nr:hypothetical protein NS226_23710 [Aureimonas ureilytica]
MIMVMTIDSQFLRAAWPKHGNKFRMLGDSLGRAGTADMMIEAQYFVCLGHDQMQIMRDHQYRTVQLMTKLVNQIIERDLTIDVHALCRLIQHQHLWLIKQRTRKQDALHFAAGQFLQGRGQQVTGLNAFERRQNVLMTCTT